MNIKQREDGMWIIDFTLKGRRIRRVIEGTKRMAQQAMIIEKDRIFRQQYGIPVRHKRIRFEDYSKLYKEHHSTKKRDPKNDLYRIGRLLVFFKGRFMDEITPGEIEKYMHLRGVEGVSNGTINRELALLKTMFYKAIASEDYGLERNPVCKVDFLKEEACRERVLKPGEMRTLIEAAINPWGGYLPLFLVIALNTGMRKNEILTLKWEHVSFKGGYIEVTADRSKSRRSRRIPMNSIVAGELRKLKPAGEHIFFNPKTGSHIMHIKTAFKRACKEAGIVNLRVHDLRHTAASYLVNECGVDIVTVSKILGHTRIDMTMRYVHPSEDNKQRGIERLGMIFEKARHKVDTKGDPAVAVIPISDYMQCN